MYICIYILCIIYSIGLYRDDGLLVLRNVNRQQINCVRKNTIEIFKGVGFLTDIEIDLKIVFFSRYNIQFKN